MADEDRTFSPTQSETNRGREQGLGVGQREMDLQGDPTRDQGDEILGEDWGEPADQGATHGADHQTRGEKTEAERGQGPKTLKANKDVISNRDA